MNEKEIIGKISEGYFPVVIGWSECTDEGRTVYRKKYRLQKGEEKYILLDIEHIDFEEIIHQYGGSDINRDARVHNIYSKNGWTGDLKGEYAYYQRVQHE